MSKSIIFSDHAEERINYRKVDKDLILRIISNPEQKMPDKEIILRYLSVNSK